MADPLVVKAETMGFEELAKKLVDQGLFVPYRNAMEKSGITGLNVAHSPGVTPVDTGRLRASETYYLDPKPIPSFVALRSNVDYAGFVHEGTVKMAARPFFKWAWERARDSIEGYFKQALNEMAGLWHR